MEQVSIEVPLARIEEDMDMDPVFGGDVQYLPDNLYIFKRDDQADSEQDKLRTFYITDDKFNEVKRAYLDIETKVAKNLAIALVDADSGNVDYQLERKLSCLGCSPFRKALLTIKSINGIDFHTIKEVRIGRTYEISPISGQTFVFHRSDSDKVFDILTDKGATRLGSIAKRYTAIHRYIRTKDGHYHIRFNENAADLNDDIKYVIVLGTFLLVCISTFDYVFLYKYSRVRQI